MSRFLRRAVTPALAVLAIVAVVGALALAIGRPAFTGDVAPGIAPPTLPACPHEDALPPGAVACVWDASEQGNQIGTDVVLVVHPHDPVLPPISTLVRDPAYQPDPRSTLGAVSASNMINMSGLGQNPGESPLPAVLASGGPDVHAMAGLGLALVVGGVGTVVGTRRRPWSEPVEPVDEPESGPEWARADVLGEAVRATPPSPLAEHVRVSNRRALARAMGDHRQLSARPTTDGRRVVVECACGSLHTSTSAGAAVRSHDAHARAEAAFYRRTAALAAE